MLKIMLLAIFTFLSIGLVFGGLFYVVITYVPDTWLRQALAMLLFIAMVYVTEYPVLRWLRRKRDQAESDGQKPEDDS